MNTPQRTITSIRLEEYPKSGGVSLVHRGEFETHNTHSLFRSLAGAIARLDSAFALSGETASFRDLVEQRFARLRMSNATTSRCFSFKVTFTQDALYLLSDKVIGARV